MPRREGTVIMVTSRKLQEYKKSVSDLKAVLNGRDGQSEAGKFFSRTHDGYKAVWNVVADNVVAVVNLHSDLVRVRGSSRYLSALLGTDKKVCPSGTLQRYRGLWSRAEKNNIYKHFFIKKGIETIRNRTGATITLDLGNRPERVSRLDILGGIAGILRDDQKVTRDAIYRLIDTVEIGHTRYITISVN